MAHRTFAALIVCVSAGASHAALFSFAADGDQSTWTFTGGQGLVTNTRERSSPQVLLVDDVDGPLPAIPFAVDFVADFSITHITSEPAGGGLFNHLYRVDGSFSFMDLDGNLLLTAEIADGELTAVGGALSWYTAAMIKAGPAHDVGTVTYRWHADRILGYDLSRAIYTPSDAQFMLDSVNMGATDVALSPSSRLPEGTWNAEAGFRGKNNIPAPGAAAIAGAFGLFALRRRR